MSSEVTESYLTIFLVSLVFSSIAICTVVIIALEFNWSVKSLLDKLKPERSTPLQKEIEAEQKEIEIMEKLKVDIEKLDQLRERRKILFAETHEEELITANDVEPLKQPDAMEKRIREWINFSFDVEDKLLEERKKDFERMQREAEEEIDEAINHYKEKLDRREGDEQ